MIVIGEHVEFGGGVMSSCCASLFTFL